MTSQVCLVTGPVHSTIVTNEFHLFLRLRMESIDVSLERGI